MHGFNYKFKKPLNIGDKVSVKSGFARNFLFPNNMALRENKKNNEYYEKIKDEMKKNEEIKVKNENNSLEKLGIVKYHQNSHNRIGYIKSIKN